MTTKLTLLTPLLCGFCLAVAAQQLGSWHLYLSYFNATQNAPAGNTVYALMNGNLLTYDTEDGEVRTLDYLNLLSDKEIALIRYSKEAGKLLIVYKNSNIDLLDKNGNITNIPALKEKNIADKEITSIGIHGTTAYLVTGFGFIELDIKEGVFRNTYRLDFANSNNSASARINCITATDDAVYIGCQDIIRRCSKKSNMHLKNNWEQHVPWGAWTHICIFRQQLLGMNPDGLFVIDPDDGNKTRRYDTGSFSYLNICDDMLIWGNNTQIGLTTDINTAPNIVKTENTWKDVTCSKGLFWMSEQENGLKSYRLEDTAFTPAGTVIQPSSPKADMAYNICWEGNRLLVAGGINTVADALYPPAAMTYENGQWTNFTEMERPAGRPDMNIKNTTNLVQDPNDPSHHFASLFRTGLCEYKDGKFVKLYDSDNSPLKSILPSSRRYYNYVSCSALSYDAKGNLWMASSQVDPALHVLKPDGNWYDLSYEPFSSASLIDQILHHSSGLVFVSSRRLEQRGVFVIDTKGTERATDDRTILHKDFINQDGTPYSPDQYFCLCEDREGNVWVGTSAGLFLMENLNQVFSSNYQFTQVKINRNDGSGLADYLLNGVSVACVTIDAANRKWVGTHNDGAYLISADCQEMIHHFTAEDTPLLSNTVQSIAIHHETGEVVFGTDKGVCSYIADATEPEYKELNKADVLVFPNPVEGDYNGPIAIRGLTQNAEVKIVSTGGQLIWNGTSSGGTCVWNGCANNGQRVANGIYHVVANTEDGDKAVVTRIVIAR